MPISLQTFEGAPGGINKAVPPHELGESEASMIVDGLVDQPGLIRRRGPVRAISGKFASAANERAAGLVQSLDPDGVHRIGLLTAGDTLNNDIMLRLLSDDYTSEVSSHKLLHNVFGGSAPYPLVDSNPTLDTGTLIGVSTSYGQGAKQVLVMWRGANKANYTTGTITNTRGSTSVTGTSTVWAANVVPGMFLLDNNGSLIGVVASVTSDTALVLEQGALVATSGAAYTLTSVRDWRRRVSKGTITTDDTDTPVLGAFTKFRDQGLDSAWDIFRMVDMTYVGTVSTVQSNTELTLAANAAVSMASENYLAIERIDHTIDPSSLPDVGWLNAVYAGREFYANKSDISSAGSDLTSRIWFSDTIDPESVDRTEADGDYIEITSTKGVNTSVRRLLPTQSSLLIFKEDETYALFGSSPQQFAVRKIADDGIFSNMSAVPYEGGAIWAGRYGIYFYDGVQVRNLANEKLGDYYLKMVREFDSDLFRMWAMTAREHYILFIEDLTDPVEVIKGSSTTSYTAITVVINLRTGALVFFTPNVSIRGTINLPAATTETTWYTVTKSDDSAIIGDTDDLFNDELALNDTATDVLGSGPDFYLESQKYSLGDGQLLKLFKQVQIHYSATITGGTDNQTAVLRLDTVRDLNDTGVLSSSRLKQETSFDNKRIKFLKRANYLAFRIYQENANVTRVVLGPWAIGFKDMRPGRV